MALYSRMCEHDEVARENLAARKMSICMTEMMRMIMKQGNNLKET